MASFLDGILYSADRKRFEQIKNTASGFSALYVGKNIIRDDIFSLIENYARKREMPLEWIRLPIEDRELCACTFIRGGRIFVMLNSGLPYSKQIFAASHELYHIRCFLEDRDYNLAGEGSILDSQTIDEGTTELEEMEANAFAGILLAPGNDLDDQMRLYGIDKGQITVADVLTLMDIFAIPYKAMVLRLMEEQVISREKAREFLEISSDDIRKRILLTGKAKRWANTPVGSEMLGSLMENLSANREEESLPESRLTADWQRVQNIKTRYGIE
ncbi:MAG: ImmA/IrrE family metallo-endopeptidase [Lachnospiraceae bacterium]|nr:ImmA/IrrE family metallo-endopeptidase [Lachnospiraceae bacterium]